MGQREQAGSSRWRLRVLAPLLVVLAVAGVLVAPAGAAAPPYCGQAWGSLPKQLGSNSPGFPPTLVTGVRAGRNTCYDRLVFDLAGPSLGYRVEYVPQVTADPSGAPVPLRGGAFLQIVLPAASHDLVGQPTYRPADPSNLVDVRTFTTFRQVAAAGDFEGSSTFGLGVRATLPFRVLVLAGPSSRVVVDVSHRWV